MKRTFTNLYYLLVALIALSACSGKPDNATLQIYCTTDVHGSIFDFDLKQNRPTRHSLAHVAGFLQEERKTGVKDYILLDAGDFLQGQPSNYYFNFIDTTQTNIVAQVQNYLGYTAAAVGNHDIEAGHPVYDKVKREMQFPWLAANAVRTDNGEPYFQPYTVVERQGIKIAILGMITPGIPKWLPTHLWKGIRFNDMIETARKWVPIIQKQENPDLLIGLFHAGYDYNYSSESKDTPCNENASYLVAQQIDGFDIIFCGHDHKEKIEEITNDAGHKVLFIDSRSHCNAVGKVTVTLKRSGDNYTKSYQAQMVNPAKYQPDSVFIATFAPALETVKKYISTPLGEFTAPLSCRDGLFGPSAFTDFIHEAQLQTTGADLSFSTILQMDAQIDKGTVTIRDMFNLYKFENGLYLMKFTGKEIDDYLEYAANLQYNTMKSKKDHLLHFKKNKSRLAAPFYNYSCAAGIKYTVDVSKEPGNRIEIKSFTDGRPFHADSTYTVAINSYRGNGGGGHLTHGMGLSKEEINNRIEKIWDKDVRYYLTEYIKAQKVITPSCRHDWEVIPARFFKAGKERDMKIIYDK